MNAKELPEDWVMPGKARYFPNPVTRPSILVLAPRQRTGLFQILLPCVLLMATSWWSRAAQRAMGSEACLPCGQAHPWMESVVVQPGCSSVDCSNASAKFLNSPRELNQQFWTLSSVLIGRNGRLGRMACPEIKSQRPPGWEWRKWPRGAHVAHKLVTNDWTQSQKLRPFFYCPVWCNASKDRLFFTTHPELDTNTSTASDVFC